MSESVPGPSHSGSVVLNVGPGVGALVLHTPAGLDGREIEISPLGNQDARRTHSQVRQRHMATVTRSAAVYPGLEAGPYTIWRDEHSPAATATITGGQVTSCRWPA